MARFGDNMREVAVTEGDKVEAQLRLGYSVNGYGIGELVNCVKQVGDTEINRLAAEYDDEYTVAEELRLGGASASLCVKQPGSSWVCELFWKRVVLQPLRSPLPKRAK